MATGRPRLAPTDVIATSAQVRHIATNVHREVANVRAIRNKCAQKPEQGTNTQTRVVRTAVTTAIATDVCQEPVSVRAVHNRSVHKQAQVGSIATRRVRTDVRTATATTVRWEHTDVRAATCKVAMRSAPATTG